MGRINFGDLAISLWVCWYVYGNKTWEWGLTASVISASRRKLRPASRGRLRSESVNVVEQCPTTLGYVMN